MPANGWASGIPMTGRYWPRRWQSDAPSGPKTPISLGAESPHGLPAASRCFCAILRNSGECISIESGRPQVGRLATRPPALAFRGAFPYHVSAFHIMLKSFCILTMAAAPLLAQDGAISAQRIRADTRFLASELLEGRGVGQRGGQLATEYIATQLELAGARPAAADGTFFQPVPLVGIETSPAATLSAVGGGKTLDFRWLDDFVAL